MPRRLLLGSGLALTLAAGGLGCGGEDTPVDPRLACLDDSIPVTADPSVPEDPAKVGILSVTETKTFLGALRDRRLRLLFFDVSESGGEAAPVQYDSGTCFRVVGQPDSTSQRPVPLSVTGVRVEGLSAGPMEIGSVTGSFVHESEDPLLGNDEVRLLARADVSGAPTFPDIDVKTNAARPIEDFRSEHDDEGNLLLFWKRGSATYMEASLVAKDPAAPDDPSRSNRVVCQFVDDGCHRVPQASLAWLSIHGDAANLQLSRHNSIETSPDGVAVATVETVHALDGDTPLSAVR